MTQMMTGVLAIIASPGDTLEERNAVRDAINDWNINNGRRAGVVILPWLYERSAVPALGGRPQAIINSQAVDRADVVVAFFDARLGTSTGVDVSGTAEEINRAHEAGKPVHVYFSNENISRDIDIKQLEDLKRFKERLSLLGLLGDYNDPADLAGQVLKAIEHDIDYFGWSEPTSSLNSIERGAHLKWAHEKIKEQKGLDSKGRMQCRTKKNRLVVRNVSQIPAKNLSFTVTGLDGAELHIDIPTEPFDVEADSTRSWTAIPLTGGCIQISATWMEGENRKEQDWTIEI